MPSVRENILLGGQALTGLVAGRARYFRALATIGEIAALYARQRLRGNASLEQTHREAAARATALCRRNGATWVKAAQFFSCRPDIMPRPWIEALQTLQNEGQPVAFERLHTVLRRELGQGWRKRFREIDPEPVATASIAQVHYARLNDGREVAVKIRLPGVTRLFDQDARIFRLVARLAAPFLSELDVDQIVEQLLGMTASELDFRNEAGNLAMFSRFQHTPGIRVPGLHEALSGERVLVTDWVQGRRLRDYLDRHPDEARDKLGLLFMSYLQQVTRFGVYQADPHPGNFIIDEQGRITILDFGVIGKLSADETKRYSRLLYGLMGFEGEVDVGQLFVDAGFEGGDPETLSELASYVLTDRLRKTDLALAMPELIELFRERHVRIPDSYIGIARVLITVGGFLMNYEVPFDWTPPERRAPREGGVG